MGYPVDGMSFKFWNACVLSILIGFCNIVVRGYVCETGPIPLSNGDVAVDEGNTFAIHKCNPYFQLKQGITLKKYMLAQCNHIGSFTQPEAICAAIAQESFSMSAECSPSIIEIENATKVALKQNKFQTFFTIYKCNEGFSWITDETFRISECSTDGTWAEIHDICVQECGVVRDCSEVKELGLTADKDYDVVPSGEVDGEVYTVYCTLTGDTDMNEVGWTNIFKNNRTPASYTEEQYLIGYNDFYDEQYFVGLEFLSNLSQKINSNDVDPGMILDVLFYNKDSQGHEQQIAHATYSNFTVGPAPDFEITSLGNYQGTAGDRMRYHENNNFVFPIERSPAWWTNSSDVISKDLEQSEAFPTLSGSWPKMPRTLAYTSIVMRVRPSVKDTANYCPMIVAAEADWLKKGTVLDDSVPYSRSPGVKITYSCLGQVKKEGRPPGSRTQNGTIECLDTDPPSWDYQAILPCIADCPEEFEYSTDNDTCLKASSEKLSFLVANEACSLLNSSLMILSQAIDMAPVSSSEFFYVANSARGKETMLIPELPTETTLKCSTSDLCNPTAEAKCIVANNQGNYKYVSCNEQFNYICQFPGWCPSGFTEVNGRCFKVSLQQTIESCIGSGGNLAYPTTIADTEALVDFLKEVFGSYDVGMKHFRLGLNKVSGNFTVGGMYDIEEALVAELESSQVGDWRFLKITNNQYEFIAANYSNELSNIEIVCEYPGPLGCDGMSPSIPAETDNLGLIWQDDVTELANAIYKCYPGYFMIKNEVTSVIEQNLQCSALTDGWPESTFSCRPYPVCKHMPTVLSPLISNSMRSRIFDFYLNSTITFTCPPGVSFLDKSTEMNSTCSVDQNGAYMFLPVEIPKCSVCLGSIEIENATVPSWVSTEVYEIGTEMTVVCDSGLVTYDKEIEQSVHCLENGWNSTSTIPCSYPNCTSARPAVSSEVIVDPNPAITHGTTLTYKCPSGMYFELTQSQPNATSVLLVTCSNSLWESDRETSPLKCSKICLGNPPSHSNQFVTNDWDNFSKENGTVITYSAEHPYLFGNMKNETVAVCENGMWKIYDGTQWPTPVSVSMLAFQDIAMYCTQSPPVPPNSFITSNWNNVLRINGTVITYNAVFPWKFENLQSKLVVACVDGEWKMYDDIEWPSPVLVPETTFYNADMFCTESPPIHSSSSITSDWDNSARNNGTIITYSAVDPFLFGNLKTKLVAVCMNGAWKIFDGVQWPNPIPLPDLTFHSAAIACHDQPAATFGGASLTSWNGGPLLENQNVVYYCPADKASSNGQRAVFVPCTSNGTWGYPTTHFLCEKACETTPPFPPQGSTYNFTGDVRLGVTIRYECSVYFRPNGEFSFISKCIGPHWTIREIFYQCPIGIQAPWDGVSGKENGILCNLYRV